MFPGLVEVVIYLNGIPYLVVHDRNLQLHLPMR